MPPKKRHFLRTPKASPSFFLGVNQCTLASEVVWIYPVLTPSPRDWTVEIRPAKTTSGMTDRTLALAAPAPRSSARYRCFCRGRVPSDSARKMSMPPGGNETVPRRRGAAIIKTRFRRTPKPDKSQGKDKTPSRGVRETVIDWLRTIAWAAVGWLILSSFLVRTFVIDSGSMEDTLLVGDFVVVNRAAFGGRVPLTGLRVPGYSEPARGDILVFDPPHDDTLVLVKRLVGMPGDTLEMRDQVLFLNGDPQNEPYVSHTGFPDYHSADMGWQIDHLVGDGIPDYRPTRDNWGPIEIPPDRYFMMGDHRDDSLDSRSWGLLERWRFEGRAVAIYFSYDRNSYRPFAWLTEARLGRIGKRF